MLPAPILVVAKLASVLDALGIRYLVGGSVASSVYGIPRATQDVDLVADMKLSHVDAFTGALSGEFYVDADMINDAIRRRASFNVIHLAKPPKRREQPWMAAAPARLRTVGAAPKAEGSNPAQVEHRHPQDARPRRCSAPRPPLAAGLFGPLAPTAGAC